MDSSPYFSLTVLFVAALGFALAPLALAWLWAKVFSPAHPNPVKNAIVIGPNVPLQSEDQATSLDIFFKPAIVNLGK